MQSTCKRHELFAKYHCPVCMWALCVQCKSHDGCCSRTCAFRRRRYGVVGAAREEPLSCGAALGRVLGLAALVGGALYLAYRLELLPR